MNNPILSQLRDIHSPDPLSLWPLAIGWYFLGTLILGLLGFIVLFLIRRYRRLAARRYLVKRLEALREEYQHEADARKIAVELSILLRRASMISFPRKDVAGLKGEEWLGFLDLTGNTQEFSKGVGRVLLSAPYQQRVEFDANNLLDLGMNWVEKNSLPLQQRGLHQ